MESISKYKFTKSFCKRLHLERHELVFRSTPIAQVIGKIGQVYGVSMQLNGINGSDSFTGVLPMNDFNKCLVVLSNLYDCRIQRHGNIVILTRKKKV